MKNKNKYSTVWVISGLLLIIQIVMFFYSGLIPVDYKILVLSISPDFVYRHSIELPVWIASLFIRTSLIAPEYFLTLLKSITLIADLFLLVHFLHRLKANKWFVTLSILFFQILFLVNGISFQFLLLLFFLTPSIYFFIRSGEQDLHTINSKRNLIISALLFGFTFLIHPVSFLLFVPLFGSLLVSKKSNKESITYLSILILFLFLSPKILWEIQNSAKPECPKFIQLPAIYDIKLSNHVIIDDGFYRWDKLYSQVDQSKKYSLLSSFENQNVFRWKYAPGSYEYLTFVYSSHSDISFDSVRNGYSNVELQMSPDEKLFFAINHGKHELMKPLSAILFWLGQWGIFLMIPVLLFITSSDKSVFYRDMKFYIILIIVAAVVLTLIKIGVGRPRPLKVYADLVHVWFTPVINRSFPSGDAQAVFTMITPLFWLRRNWFFVLFPAACLTALNRVVTGAHFPFDILIGSMLGFSVSAVLKLWTWDREK